MAEYDKSNDILDNADLEDDYPEDNMNKTNGGRSGKDSAPKRHIITTVLLVFFFLLFLISAMALIKSLSDYKKGVDIYESIQAAVFITETTQLVPEGTTAATKEYESVSYAEIETDAPIENINLEEVRKLNPQGICWIQIPAITRSYPVAQGTDNTYYLTHTFTHEENSAGSIFMDARNYPDFSDKNTIIYGHNMMNGTMFGMLNRFEKEDFFREHNNCFFITTDTGIRAYQIFACCIVPSDSIVYTLDFDEEVSFSDFLNYVKDKSLYSTNVSVLPTDYVVTLSTCTSDSKSRRIVLGKYIGNIKN